MNDASFDAPTATDTDADSGEISITGGSTGVRTTSTTSVAFFVPVVSEAEMSTLYVPNIIVESAVTV